MKWRIYYGDGSTASSEDCSPFDVPPSNMQAVVIDRGDGAGPLVIEGKHYAFWTEFHGWTPCDEWGWRDYLANHLGPKVVLFGRTIPDADYRAVVSRAMRELLG